MNDQTPRGAAMNTPSQFFLMPPNAKLSRAAERPRRSDHVTTLCRGREADSA